MHHRLFKLLLTRLPVEIKDETGEVVARVTKTLYVRRKRKVEG